MGELCGFVVYYKIVQKGWSRVGLTQKCQNKLFVLSIWLTSGAKVFVVGCIIYTISL